MLSAILCRIGLLVARYIFGMPHKTPEELELLVHESWRIWLEGPFPHSTEDVQP
jgi:hypothetical protein